MFKLLIQNPKNSEEWNWMWDSIKKMGKIHGIISVQMVLNVFCPDYKYMEDAYKKGWNYEDLHINGYPIFESSPDHLGTGLLILPDPIDITSWINKGEFDPVQKPAHYAEGRKYEPRKVIYDWGLNFNLGNAVKYIARAGRKGDKIEDLRKAIQYIEFEIEELTNTGSVRGSETDMEISNKEDDQNE